MGYNLQHLHLLAQSNQRDSQDSLKRLADSLQGRIALRDTLHSQDSRHQVQMCGHYLYQLRTALEHMLCRSPARPRFAKIPVDNLYTPVAAEDLGIALPNKQYTLRHH